MATIKWLGGATAVAQVSTVTLNNDFNDSETDLTLTLTAEDGSTTQSVSITPSGTDESTIASALQTACAASNQSLFQAITFTVASNVVTLTAKVAGVPFYFASSVTGGAGTTTDATGTANGGPNDWNTAANWSTGSVPTSSDNVVITDGSFDILHGLDQSSVSLGTLAVNAGFSGSVGDPGNGYSLQIGGTAGSIRASGPVWVEGSFTSWVVSKTPTGTDAVVLRDTVGSFVHILGAEVLGTIRLRDGTGGTTLIIAGCPRASVLIEENVGISKIWMGAGAVTARSEIQDLVLWGGRLLCEEGGVYNSYEQYGGTLLANGSPTSNGGKWFGDAGAKSIMGGTLSFAGNTAADVTIEQALEIYGGTVDFRSGLDNITFDANPTVYGGTVINEQNQSFDPTP